MREFLKTNKWKLLISSIIILLPVAVGLIFWDKLPETMNTHWGMDGTPDHQGSKSLAVFGLPLILLALHWLCALTSCIGRNKNQNKKVISIVMLIIPFTSLLVNFIIYATAFDMNIDMLAVLLIAMGVMFVVFGNYMPKCKQNSTIGVKLVWTLANEENWNKTHRIAGKAWVIGGVTVMLMSFIPGVIKFVLFFVALTVMMLIPTVYSYRLYKEQLKDGRVKESAIKEIRKKNKGVAIAMLITLPVLLVFLGVLCFTGDIEIEYADTSFTVRADYYEDFTLEYGKIISVELYYEDDSGARTFGFYSPVLSMGAYKNDTFGNHTRYTYTQTDMCVVVKTDSKILVLNGENDDATRAIYNELWARING